jgi:cystathionine beta-lyase/cystathionine gamma-synthase
MSWRTKGWGLDTRSIHAGQAPDPVHGAVVPSIVLSSTFAQRAPGEPTAFDYSRSGNPTRAALEECLASLEGGERAFAFSSGCAAATCVLTAFSPGPEVICGDDVYGGTYRLMARVLADFGLRVRFIDLRRLDPLAEALRQPTTLVWLESPTNPLQATTTAG